MLTRIVRKLTPEEEEVHHKRRELADIQSTLAERELELADLRSHLAAFEGRYLREIGVLYAELDNWDARIAELTASLERSASAHQRAERTRKRATDSHEATHGEASRIRDFKPSAELKNLFRDVAKRIHPDFAKDAADQKRRTRYMTQANEAYSKGDTAALRRILDDYHDSSETVTAEGIGAELIRLIRQIAEGKKHIVVIEQELNMLRASELAKLKENTERAHQQERDLLAELAAKVLEQITRAKREYETLEQELTNRG